MRCPHCDAELKQVDVTIEGTERKVRSHQCPRCDYYRFERSSRDAALSELQKAPLKIRQSVITLSHGRLGIYLSKHIVESLGIKRGDCFKASVPDERHIVLELE